MHVVHATIASSASFWLVGWLRPTLSDSCLRLRIFHVAFIPDPVVKVLDLVLIQTDVSDVLPKGIDIAGSIESCKVRRRLGVLLAWLPRRVRHVGLVWVEPAASKNRAVLFFEGCFLLDIFDGRSEGVGCFECRCRRLHESRSVRALHFDRSASSHA